MTLLESVLHNLQTIFAIQLEIQLEDKIFHSKDALTMRELQEKLTWVRGLGR